MRYRFGRRRFLCNFSTRQVAEMRGSREKCMFWYKALCLGLCITNDDDYHHDGGYITGCSQHVTLGGSKRLVIGPIVSHLFSQHVIDFHSHIGSGLFCFQGDTRFRVVDLLEEWIVRKREKVTNNKPIYSSEQIQSLSLRRRAQGITIPFERKSDAMKKGHGFI